MNIYASGTVDLEDAYIEADGSVSVESGGKLALGQSSSDSIEAGEDGAAGSLTLKSDNGEVFVYDYDLYDYGTGDITISAAAMWW